MKAKDNVTKHIREIEKPMFKSEEQKALHDSLVTKMTLGLMYGGEIIEEKPKEQR